MSPNSATNTGKKRQGKKPPASADYMDFVNDQHLQRIKELASDDDQKAAEPASEAAW